MYRYEFLYKYLRPMVSNIEALLRCAKNEYLSSGTNKQPLYEQRASVYEIQSNKININV